MRTFEDVVLLCQETLQDSREVAASGIEYLEHKDTKSYAHLQEGRRESAARELFPLGVQSDNHLALWWVTSDFFEKARCHRRVTSYRRVEELPLEWLPIMVRRCWTLRRGAQALPLRR